MLKPQISQFSIRTVLIVTAFCALGLGWLADRTRLRQEQLAVLVASKATHKYVLTLDGTPGVRLAMTLVTKPVSKRTETITLPFSLTFEANEAEVWIEYLPEGQSGNDGDKIEMTMTKDGDSRLFPNVSGSIRKDARKTVYVNGDIHWSIGDL